MSTATVALLVAGFLCGLALIGRGNRLRLVSAPSKPPRTSVIIPARDEERRLPLLLRALALTEPAPFEVIVVDDGSTDATPFLAHQAGAIVLPVEPPPGWTGKAWACHRGAEVATGEILVFLDADTEPTPEGVAALVALAERGALVSAQPRHRIERPYERLSAGPALVSVLGAGIGPPPAHRWWRRPVAFGPALALPAAEYTRIGGHAVVRESVTEDLALAEVADRAGVAVRSTLGGDLIGYRMYPEGPGRLVEGWSKNLASGAGSIPPLRLAATVLWVAAALQAAVIAAWTWTGMDSGVDMGMALATYLPFAGQVGIVLHRIGRFGPLTTALYPAPLLVFLVLFARSVVLTLAPASRPVAGAPGPGRTLRRPTVDAIPLLLANSAVWAGWSAVVGYGAHRLPSSRLDRDGWLTRLRPWERGGRVYERLAIRRWKDMLPDAGEVFRGGTSKRALPGRTSADLRRFAAETRRAELVHWGIPLVTPVFALWSPPLLLAAMVAYAVVANLPCLVVQRFNRGRILRVLERRQPVGAVPGT